MNEHGEPVSSRSEVDKDTGLPLLITRYADGYEAVQLNVCYGTAEGKAARLLSQVEVQPQSLRWHYGPTQADPEPGKMWCYDCGGNVMFIDDGYICLKCHRQSSE